MRTNLPLFLIAAMAIMEASPVWGQRGDNEKDSVTTLLRIYEDDDYINFWGCGTDNAYTNGSRIDYFYTPAHSPHGILGRFGLRAGPESRDVYSWGIFELMYTPDNITKTAWQPHDYQYAGAIIATHSRISVNALKKYSVLTEIVAGLIGPSAMGKQLQSGFHRLIHYTQPMGWGHQFRNDALLNVNLTLEKQIAAASNWLTVIGGAQLYTGTMQNGAAIYPLLLVGKMTPYFDGFFSRYTSSGQDHRGRKNWQFYFLFKPELQYFAQNALLQGGAFTHNPNAISQPKTIAGDGSLQQEQTATEKAPELATWVPNFSYGFVFTRGNFGFSMTQNVSAPTLRHLYCHDVGNVTLYFGL